MQPIERPIVDLYRYKILGRGVTLLRLEDLVSVSEFCGAFLPRSEKINVGNCHSVAVSKSLKKSTFSFRRRFIDSYFFVWFLRSLIFLSVIIGHSN